MTPLSSQKATARACGCVRSPRPFVVRSWQHACTRHDLLQCRENGSRFRRLEHASTFQYPAVSALIRCVRWCDGAVKQLRAMTLHHRMRLWVSTCCQSSYCFVLPLSCLCSLLFLFFSLFLSFSNILFTLSCLLILSTGKITGWLWWMASCTLLVGMGPPGTARYPPWKSTTSQNKHGGWWLGTCQHETAWVAPRAGASSCWLVDTSGTRAEATPFEAAMQTAAVAAAVAVTVGLATTAAV